MGKFVHFEEIIERTDGNTAFAAGTTGIKYTISRRNKRLFALRIVANVTLGAGMVTSGAGRPGLEGIFSNITWNMSDMGNSARDAVKLGSAQLLYFNYFNDTNQSRYVKTVMGQVNAGTYNVVLRIPFVHPGSSNLVAYRQSIPFWERRTNETIGLGDNPTLTIDCAALDSASLGIKTGALTFNDVKLVLEWVDIGREAGIAYAPMVLDTFKWDTTSAGSSQKQTFPKDGFLTSYIAETFATPAIGVYGAVLTSATTGKFMENFGGVKRDEFNPVSAVDHQERFTKSYPEDVATMAVHNLNASIFFRDKWMPDPHNDAGWLDSCPNLYQGGNKGDAFEFEPNDIATGKQIRFTQHKFLITNPDILTGA